jgi:hypothetical protein
VSGGLLKKSLRRGTTPLTINNVFFQLFIFLQLQ